MKPQLQCSQCGKLLPEGAEDGNCPSCLLEWGLDTSPDDSTTVLGATEPTPLEAPALGPTENFRRLPYFGDYELLDEIARGGMGVVYRARQVSLNRTVAVKMILAAQFAGKDTLLRFQTEARAAARLRHPHIVGIHEVGEHEGFHYFSMDYIEGKNLGQVIRETPVLPRRAAQWVKTIAEAIHYAHEQGILHRDLKPSNILIDPAGAPHVTDFGLAKHIEGQSDITVSGQILGSPNYMPPEQASVRRGQVGRASDVYSLGAVLYHLLTGRSPFVGENAAATMHAVLHQEVIAPRLINPNTPPDLETICLKCLEKEPRRRYQTALELADELGRFLRDEPILARPISRREKTWRWCRRKPVIAILAASLVVVFLAGVAGVLTQLRRAENKSEENRQQVARLNVLTGVQFMQAGDYFKSLLWFAEAFAADRGAPEREAIHQMRLAAVLEQCPKLVQIISHDGQPIGAASFSPADDRLATVGADHTVRVWGIPDGRLLMKTEPLAALPLSVMFSPDGSRLLVVLLDNTARLLDPQTGQETCAPLPHRSEGAYTAFFPVFDPPATKLLTQPKEKELQIWDLPNARPVGPRLVHTNQIERAQFSADGSLLFTRAHANFAWDTQTGESVPFPAHGPEATEDFFFSPYSNVAVLGGRIWKWPSDEPRSSRREEAHTSKSEIRNLSEPERSRSRRPKSETEMTPVGEPLMDPRLLIRAAFSPSGDRLITTGRDRTARIWDTATAQPLVPPLPHDQIVQNAVFSPDGRRVLTVSQDSLRRVWDADTGQPLTPPINHALGAPGIFSGSGRYFLTRYPEFLLCVWDLHREAAPPVLLRPLQPTGINEMALRGLVSVSKEMNNLIRVRSMLGGLDVPLHPISMKIVPMQAWLDETSHFVILEGEMAKAQVWDVASGLPITPLVRSQYTLNETAYRTVMLPSSRLSASDATDLAQLLSGSRLDGTGGWTPLKLEEITAAWERLTRNSKIQNPKSKIERRGREPAAHDALSLTPALSRWERESGRPRTEDSNASGVVKGPSAIPPLPAGEGRGEGERHATPEQSGTAQTAPAPFVGPSSVPLETWHEQEAKAAAGALDWFAAAFHWQQLARLHADHPEFALLRSYAEQCLAKARTTAKSYEELRRVIPPRDPRADAPLIDLSDHYTGAITEGFRVGMQKLGGVSFDVRGQIELFGLGAEARGHRHPEKVSGIKIQQRCARLHFLHSVEGGAYRTEGEPLATLVVAYANGQSEKLAIQNRVHAGGDRSGSEYAPKQAEAVWIGTNPFANSLQWSVWLYKYTWANPHPDWEISHIDLVSAKTEASYVLLAMSVE